MRVCRECLTEYDSHLGSCPKCGLPPRDGDLSRDSHEPVTLFVRLATFANSAAADMVQELLESNGIHATVRGDIDPIGSMSGAEPIQLLVPAAELDAAREIYEAFFAGTPPDDQGNTAGG